jgi:isopenicillin N synthase-like dioxygenase
VTKHLRSGSLLVVSVLIVADDLIQISWHEVVTTGASHLPPLLRTQGLSLQRFSAACQELCLAILKGLSPDLLVHHRSGQPSETGLKFISEPALEKASDVGDYTHTDGGTLTMLFYSDWGLQTLLKESQKWAFIAPKDGCVVVNVADSLERLSGGRFHSPKHRITQPTDGQAKRYYLSYFLRPQLAVKASWAAQ